MDSRDSLELQSISHSLTKCSARVHFSLSLISLMVFSALSLLHLSFCTLQKSSVSGVIHWSSFLIYSFCTPYDLFPLRCNVFKGIAHTTMKNMSYILMLFQTLMTFLCAIQKEELQ